MSEMSELELGTFCGAPRAPLDSGADVAIVGVPFDVGTNPYRIGCRQGPDHIRRSFHPDRRFLFHSDDAPFDELTVVDCGNIRLVPGQPIEAYAAIQEAMALLLGAGSLPVTMGGDGAVTLPQLRAAKAHHSDLAVIHCDAHTDNWDVDGTGPYTTSTTFLRATEEGLVAPGMIFHIGARGTVGSARGTMKRVAATGQPVVTTDEFHRRGPDDIAAELTTAIGDRPTYLCWDMDFFDPSAAPGVAAPEWGGPSTWEALQFLRNLQGLRLIACDVNTVSPPHDLANMTGNLGARVMIEFINMIASQRRATTSEPAASGRS